MISTGSYCIDAELGAAATKTRTTTLQKLAPGARFSGAALPSAATSVSARALLAPVAALAPTTAPSLPPYDTAYEPSPPRLPTDQKLAYEPSVPTATALDTTSQAFQPTATSWPNATYPIPTTSPSGDMNVFRPQTGTTDVVAFDPAFQAPSPTDQFSPLAPPGGRPPGAFPGSDGIPSSASTPTTDASGDGSGGGGGGGDAATVDPLTSSGTSPDTACPSCPQPRAAWPWWLLAVAAAGAAGYWLAQPDKETAT